MEPPVTIRQLYYQLVGHGHVQNTHGSYRQIQHLLVWLRRQGVIPYNWIVDRTRQPIEDSTWSDLGDFADTVRQAYRKSLWQSQPDYVEFWLEKDALSSFFERITRPYQVRLMVGRGFSSISFLYEAAMDLRDVRKPIYIYHFGDHDPSGHSIEAKIRSTLNEHGIVLEKFERVAILPEDIKRFNLPPALAKRTDPRYRHFVKRYGTESVELDALPPDELRKRIMSCITRHIDAEEWRRLQVIEDAEQRTLAKIISPLFSR